VKRTNKFVKIKDNEIKDPFRSFLPILDTDYWQQNKINGRMRHLLWFSQGREIRNSAILHWANHEWQLARFCF
jgi:hypothetical protein